MTKIVWQSSFHERSKHIDIRYHFVRDDVSEKIVDVKYLSDKMIADILTKGLPSVKVKQFVNSLGLGDT